MRIRLFRVGGQMRRRRIIKIVALGLTLMVAALWVHVLVLLALGRREQPCTVGQALQGPWAMLKVNGTERWYSWRTTEVQREGKHRLVETPAGRWWLPGPKADISLVLAEQALDIYGTAQGGVRAGDVVLDCGAHVGAYARAALAQGARLVVAIEPERENLEVLRRNLEGPIREGRVVVYPKGVWDKEGTLELNLSSEQSSGSHSLYFQAERGTEVIALTTIDKLVEELKLERVDVIKIDIEGSERNAIAGARSVLTRDRPRLALASYHRPDDPAVLAETVRQAFPHYRVRASSCGEWDRIYPNVMLFDPERAETP